jgi:hypothetical protein
MVLSLRVVWTWIGLGWETGGVFALSAYRQHIEKIKGKPEFDGTGRPHATQRHMA